MQALIVPTDFSPNARNAAGFAAALAGQLNAELVLLHVYWVPVSVHTGETTEAIRKKEAQLRTDARQSLEVLAARLGQQYPGLAVTYEVRNGFVADEVVALAEERKAGCIVMGTQGAGNWRQAIIGTNTADVIERAVCPVMAIPEKATWQEFRQITLAAGFQNPDHANLRWLVDMIEAVGAKITLLHVSDTEYGAESEQALRQWFTARTAGYIDPEDIRYEWIVGSNVLKEIEAYLQTHRTDLLVMITHKRTFFRQLFQPSLSRQEALHTRIPLLVLQASDRISG
jgi:nucleotide-binding universal stress UspA family protein